MAHNVRIRLVGGWAASTVWTPSEAQTADNYMFASINGDDGGSWAPTTKITLTGVQGLHSFVLRGGNDGFGTSTFLVDGTSMNVAADVTFDGSVLFQGSDPIDFATNVNFNANADFDGGVDATGATSFHLNADGLEIKTNEQKALRKDAQAFNLRMISYNFSPFIGTMWAAGNDASGPGIVRQQVGTTAGLGYIEVILSPSCTYDLIGIVGKANTGHGGVMPTTRVAYQVFKIDMSTRVRTNLSAVVAAPNTIGAYEAQHLVNLAFTSFRPSTQERYYVEMTNESGGSAQLNYEVQGIYASGFSDRWGRCPRDPFAFT